MQTDGLSGEVVNLANPEEHTILQFAERIMALTGHTTPIFFEPLPEDDPQRRRPDIAKAKRLLDWEPCVSLDEGLQRTIDFFRGDLALVGAL